MNKEQTAKEYANENMWYPGEISYESDIVKMTQSFTDAFDAGVKWADAHPAKKQSIEKINALIKEIQPNEGQISDGYHTFDELYDFRREYNAALVNTHAYPCHKSLRHSDGELCFGGGWFIVIINLPTGQISNHYEIKYWDEFDCEERECAEQWDGHTEKDVLARLSDLNLNNPAKKQTVAINIDKALIFYEHLLDLVELERTSKHFPKWCDLEKEYISLIGEEYFKEHFNKNINE